MFFLKSQYKKTNSRYLSVAPSSINLGYNAGSYNVNIFSDSLWNIESDKSWLTLDKTSGSGREAVMLTFTENLTEPLRNANITVKSGSITRIIRVTQAKKDKSVTILKCQTPPVIDGNPI